jgi:hypothetical protein
MKAIPKTMKAAVVEKFILRFKFDREGKYSFNFGLFSGNNFARNVAYISVGAPLLPRAVAPDEASEVVIEHACPSEPGLYTLKIDLVDQHVCWFEERGSKALSLPMKVR